MKQRSDITANQLLRRAVELAQGGDHESALVEVKRALKLEPDHPKGLIFRFTLEARLLRRAKRPGEAAVRYRAVLALDSTNAEAKRMLVEYDRANQQAGDPQTPMAPKRARPASEETCEEPVTGTIMQRLGPEASRHQTNAPREPIRSPIERETPQGGAARSISNDSSDRPTQQPPPPVAAPLLESLKPVSQRALSSMRAPHSEPPVIEVVPFGRGRGGSTNSERTSSTQRAEEKKMHEPKDAVGIARTAVESTKARAPDSASVELPPPSTQIPISPERRIAPRVAIEVNVGISSESNFFTGFSGDISEGGLFIATYNLLPISSQVEVSFGVLGHEITTDAVVRWIRDPIDINVMPGFGVCFGRLTEKDQEAIATFIKARAPMFFDDDE